jgi:hypoxanthine-DNA glycosylase
MTLHEAIEKLLSQEKRALTTQEIADELNTTGWYRKKDGSPTQPFQIHSRTKNYPSIFARDGASVSLSNQKVKKAEARPVKLLKISTATPNITKRSFQPISSPDTKILILGTMPGDKSIALGEYYGHPRNRFWQMISNITNNPLPQDYIQKKALLLRTKIGIWDVVHTAIRKGSLDSAITGEEPNDLDSFISKHEKLRVIAFNGAKAKALFDKYFTKHDTIKYLSLPSTSPANTGISFQEICNEWMQILRY